MTDRDYKSFSSVAKSRFRPMAKELGYEQLSGTFYVKPRDGWYESYNLQYSSYGNPFFYFNYGVLLPKVFPGTLQELRASGWYLGRRLRYKGEGAFPAQTRAKIEESARYALEIYRKEASPWLNNLTLGKIHEKLGRLK